MGDRAVRRRCSKRKLLRERDGDDCHLCHAPMVFKNRANPDFATLDHIVPRSLGGRSTLDNLKLAHRKCNERRGNGPVKRMGWE
jgi:5-methylcytosine-specific restriction endonuclease McrA